MAFQGGDTSVGAVVADIGSFATKIGWAGDDAPKSYFRSNVAVLKEEESESGRSNIRGVNYDYYTHPIDPKTFDDGSWKPCNPIHSATGLWYDAESAQGADWYDLMDKFLSHGYRTGLQGAALSDHPLILAERSYNPAAIRQQTLECLFEQLNIPAVFLSKDAVLSCYGCGRTTATVVDVGYTGTTVTPVFDGYAEPKGIRRSPVGLHAADTLLLQQLDALHLKMTKKPEILPIYQVRPVRPGQDPPGQTLPRAQRMEAIHVPARLQIAQECRELGAGSAISSDNSTSFHAPHKPFTLPDDTVLDVTSATRFATADLIYADSPRRQELYDECVSEVQRLVAVSLKEDDEEDVEGKFSQAASVGVSKRRGQRSGQPKAPAKKPVFSNRLLRGACRPYLKTLAEEQLSGKSLANMVCDSAYSCERDQQGALLGNIVVGGGGSCIGPTDQAVPDRIRESVEALIHQHTPAWRVKVTTPAINERAVLSWLGGSILGSLGTFPEMWISRSEYEEWGSAVVNRKCP